MLQNGQNCQRPISIQGEKKIFYLFFFLNLCKSKLVILRRGCHSNFSVYSCFPNCKLEYMSVLKLSPSTVLSNLVYYYYSLTVKTQKLSSVSQHKQLTLPDRLPDFQNSPAAVLLPSLKLL